MSFDSGKWLESAAVILLTALGLGFCASQSKADTVPAAGSGLSWSVTLPGGATDTSLSVLCYDCDYPDEATLTVNGGTPLVLFGTRDAARDGRVVTVVIVTALQTGANTLRFACVRTANCIRIDGIAVNYTVPESEWLTTARRLESLGWVPGWFSTDDDIWVVSREDTDPARVLVCAKDRATGQSGVAWFPADVGRMPEGPAPAVTECELAWCAVSGSGRQAAIDAACQ